MTRDRKPEEVIGSLIDPKATLLILHWVDTNLMSKSLQNVLTNFLILRCVVMDKGPMYRNLQYKQLFLRATL